TLEEYNGQEHNQPPGPLLRPAVQADHLSSLLFYGPPGTGKTTLASVIANTTKSTFVTLNAVMAGIADLKDVTQAAQRRKEDLGLRTILFVDEVHRWNKAQQDALLPWVENGTVILIGATTENPYFTVNRALVSRSRIFQLKPLEESHIRRIIQQALQDKERGYGNLNVQLDEDALAHLANVANGDARAALNAIELAVETTQPDETGRIHVTMSVAEESIQRRAVLYDREGDYHFDTISAFIKSMRGSDPDATFYWLSKMVYAGEDPRFLFRRMIIFASEDIGMADPHALPFVMAAAEAFDRVGLPEGHFPLAHAALYCATAPKSNSVMGFFDALKAVEQEQEGEVPNHLKDGSRDKESFGHGVGYQYPHAFKDHWVAQQYLPGSLQGKVFYEPGVIGYEKSLADLVRQRRELQLAALRENDGATAPPEVLTFAKTNTLADKWLARAVDNLTGTLATIRDRLFATRPLRRHELVLDLTADTGELTWQAVRSVPEGGVWSLTSSVQAGTALHDMAANLPQLRSPAILVGAPEQIADLLAAARAGDVRFDFITGRNLLARCANRTACLTVLKSLLRSGGTLALAENLPRRSQRLTALLPPPGNDEESALRQRLASAEETVYANPDDPRVNWDTQEISQAFLEAGFPAPSQELLPVQRPMVLTQQHLEHWFHGPNSFASSLTAHGLSQEDLQSFREALSRNVLNRTVPWHNTTAIFHITL
ncbi:MAG: AAA family ATPase, partial [Victivallales bacterium]|nr:AAA family ATPase [Victivallales bacterium]